MRDAAPRGPLISVANEWSGSDGDIVNAAFQALGGERRDAVLAPLQEVARERGNVFEALMEAVKAASLGQVSGALYEVGGEYRRNM